jgi:hypothetical protein
MVAAENKLKARICELEEELAAASDRIDELTEASSATASPEEERGKPVKSELIAKFIRMTGDPSEHEARQAAGRLISALMANEADRHALADLWDKHCEQAARQRPAKPKPINWPEVEAAVVSYAEGKTTVTVNKTLRAIKDAIKDDITVLGEVGARYIHSTLTRLGFTRSASGLTYSRPAPSPAP